MATQISTFAKGNEQPGTAPHRGATKLGLLLLVWAASPAHAQKVLWHDVGQIPPTPFGNSGFPSDFDAGRDVDGDGIGDVVVGTFGADKELKGQVKVLSGVDGHLIHIVYGTDSQAYLGFALLLPGDMNGDGLSEFASATVGGPVRIYSGADASLLKTIAPPASWYCQVWKPKAVLHFDGDGIPDLALGCPAGSPPGAPSGGGVAIVSGADGAVQALWTAATFLDRLGHSVSNAGDLDGDGVDDLIAGAPGYGDINKPDEPYHPNYALALSSATGSTIYTFKPDPDGGGWNMRFGWSVSGGGDVDGDGVPDAIVGEMQNFSDVKGLEIFDGATGATLHETHNREGRQVRHLGDVDGDGFGDYLGTAETFDCEATGYVGCGAAYVFSGEDHSLIYTLKLDGTFQLGDWAAASGDVDGDDFPDVLVGDRGYRVNPTTDNKPRGRVSMFSLAPLGVQAFGSGCPGYEGVVPRIGARGSPAVGATVEIHLSKAAPGVPALLLLGTSTTSYPPYALPLDLSLIGMPGCSLLTSIELYWNALTQAAAPAPGRATVPIAIPANPSFSGQTLYVQWFVGSAAGVPASTTRGLALTIG